MTETVNAVFGNRLRVRASGLCIQDNSVLLVAHRGLVEGALYWAPPGGGVEFGESVRSAVKREILEETGLTVEVGEFMFLREFLRHPLHAIELYFKTPVIAPFSFSPGSDPELCADNQLIAALRLMTLQEIKSLEKGTYDPIFDEIDSLESLYDGLQWTGIQKRLI